jgi:hypothetical protein
MAHPLGLIKKEADDFRDATCETRRRVKMRNAQCSSDSEEDQETFGLTDPQSSVVVNKKAYKDQKLGEEGAYSYYHNYLKIILPSLATRVKRHQALGRLKPILCIMLPWSCVCPETLTDVLPSCTVAPSADWVNPLTVSKAGTVLRTYTNTVYKLEDKRYTYPLLLMCEYAPHLKVLREMWLDEVISYESRVNARHAFVSRLSSVLQNDKTIPINSYHLFGFNDLNISSEDDRRKKHTTAIEEAFELLANDDEVPKRKHGILFANKV